MCRIEDKGDRTIISSKLIPDEAMGVCVKLTGLEGIQTEQVSIKIHMRLCMSVHMCVRVSESVSQSLGVSLITLLLNNNVTLDQDPRMLRHILGISLLCIHIYNNNVRAD
jgi:transcriptional regulator CtsR